MEYLIAVDLEGIHGIVGEVNKTLTASKDYPDACYAAALEINAVARALFDSGATKVAVWDNHGGGNNVDFSQVDGRCQRIDPKGDAFRYDFVKEHNFRAIIFLGYHAKEGTPRGVLAHTFSSVGIQYVKLNGGEIGELFVDSYISAYHGITPIFLAGDDVALREMQGICPGISTVTTKYGKRRNEAELRPRDEVLSEIYDTVLRTVSKELPSYDHAFPRGAHLEVRYTRAERADSVYDKVTAAGEIPIYRGSDTHTLHFTVERANQIPKLL
jgi:D-amino peptidase